jgi:hypothetical protein
MDVRHVEFDRDDFDIKLGAAGKVQFIFKTTQEKDAKTAKQEALNFIKALTIGKNKHFIHQIGVNGIETQIKTINDEKVYYFIVRQNEDDYESFAPGKPKPSADIRRGKGSPPLWQIAYADKEDALKYGKQLKDMGITPIVPTAFENTHISDGVCSQRGEFIIRIDNDSKLKLDASFAYFQHIESYAQIKATEEACRKILTDFNIKVLIPHTGNTTKTYASVSTAFNEEWSSNQAKINNICAAVEERTGLWLNLARGSEGDNFRQTFNQYTLKEKMTNAKKEALEPQDQTGLVEQFQTLTVHDPVQQQAQELLIQQQLAMEQQLLATQHAQMLVQQQEWMLQQQLAAQQQEWMMQQQLATQQQQQYAQPTPEQQHFLAMQHHAHQIAEEAKARQEWMAQQSQQAVNTNTPWTQTQNVATAFAYPQHQPQPHPYAAPANSYATQIPPGYATSPFLLNAHPQPMQGLGQVHTQEEAAAAQVDPTKTENTTFRF